MFLVCLSSNLISQNGSFRGPDSATFPTPSPLASLSELYHSYVTQSLQMGIDQEVKEGNFCSCQSINFEVYKKSQETPVMQTVSLQPYSHFRRLRQPQTRLHALNLISSHLSLLRSLSACLCYSQMGHCDNKSCIGGYLVIQCSLCAGHSPRSVLFASYLRRSD